MLSQHIFSMSIVIMPVGIIMQTMPFLSILQVIVGIIGMPQQAIIGMPPHIIPQGTPLAIIVVMVSQQSFIISIVVPSAGFITHIMPLAVIEQSMWHIIGIMVAIGIAGMPIIGMFGICIMPIGMFIMFIAVFMQGSVKLRLWRPCRGALHMFKRQYHYAHSS